MRQITRSPPELLIPRGPGKVTGEEDSPVKGLNPRIDGRSSHETINSLCALWYFEPSSQRTALLAQRGTPLHVLC